MSMALGDYLTLGSRDGTQAQALRFVDNRELGEYAPVFVLLLLTEELDAFVDFNVIFTANVCYLKFVFRHKKLN